MSSIIFGECNSQSRFSAKEPLLMDDDGKGTSSRDVPLGGEDERKGLLAKAIAKNPEFFEQAFKFGMCFTGLQA